LRLDAQTVALHTCLCIMLAVRSQLRSGMYALYSYLDAWSVRSCTLRGAPREAMVKAMEGYRNWMRWTFKEAPGTASEEHVRDE
jgi:hypothetical protein